MTDNNQYPDGGTASTTDRDGSETLEQGNQPRNSEQPVQTAGLTQILSRPDVKRQIKYAAGIFAIIGLGFGLTGFVFNEYLIPGVTGTSGEGSSSSGQFVSAILQLISVVGIVIMTSLSGSIVGAISSLRVADEIDNTRAAYVASAAGNGLGYVLMLIVTVLVMAATVSTGSSSSGSSSGGSGPAEGFLNLGDMLVPIILLAIPVVIVGVATIYLSRKLDKPPHSARSH